MERVSAFKLLGLWIDDDLKWQTNTDYIIGKAVKRLFLLKFLKKFGADKIDMKRFYISAIRPTLEYGAQVWHGGLTKAQSSSIEKVQRRALRIIYSEKDYEKLLLKAGMHTLEQHRNTMCIDLISKMSDPQHKLHHLIYFIYLALPTRAGSPQQHMPITVGPFYLTHPVNFPCGRKPEYPGKTHD